jgi:hypothetical protein
LDFATNLVTTGIRHKELEEVANTDAFRAKLKAHRAKLTAD